MDLTAKLFETKRKLHMLHATDRLGIPPGSEIGTLFTIQDLNGRAGTEGARVSEIAALLNVSVPTVSRCLQKLSEKGFIRKTLDENDRRSTCVTLTPQGEEFCRHCKGILNPYIARVVSHLEPEEIAQFIRIFDKLIDAAKAELPETPQNSQ